MQELEPDDITQLKLAIKQLEQRIGMLEAWAADEHASRLSGAPSRTPPPLPGTPPPLPSSIPPWSPGVPPPPVLPGPRSMPAMLRAQPAADKDTSHSSVSPPATSSTQAPLVTLSLTSTASSVPRSPGKPARSLETRIGLYWLNRLGIASLVLGVVFLILYSFQYFGAPAKIATGYACAGLLILGAHRLWSRSDILWYAQGLAGGGWALAYFTTFAMGYIPGVQLIPNSTLELFLLIAVAGGALWQALYRDSETIAVLSNVLAFVSVFVAGISTSTILATAILLAALGYCTGKKQWFGLYVSAVLCSYASFIGAQSHTSVPAGANLGTPEIVIPIVIYTMFWITYTMLGIRLQPADAPSRRLLVWGCVLNGLTYAACMSFVLGSAHIEQHWVAPLALGAAYLAAFKIQGKTAPAAVAHLVMGLTFLNLALWNMFDNSISTAVGAVECCLLTYLGLRYAIPSMRWFSLFVGLGIGLEALMQIGVQTGYFFDIKAWIPLLILCACSCSLCAYLYGSKFLDTVETRPWENFFIVYFLSALYLFYMVPTYGFQGNARALMWAAETAAAGYLGFRLRRQAMRATAAVVTVFWALAVSFNSGDISTGATILILAGLVAQLLYIDRRGQEISSNERNVLFYCVLGSAMLINLCSSGKLPPQLVSPVSAVEGVILLALGFAWRDKAIRVWALLIFATLMIKLLFVDLASAGTIERIISFIITGIALLACSYGYACYVKQQEKVPETSLTDSDDKGETESA